ncbi:MAG: aminoacyl-tRNA hydrolase [Proteobacteria bacterium]|nr:aminoacyl-tRNA hydrolase [Pseudomonadota bacterium]
MKLIIGLGNPGSEYTATRHNVGFWVADALQEVFGLPGFAKKCKGLVAKGRMVGMDVVVLKPQTFMNLSGESVQAAMAFYKVAAADMLVIHDELDLVVGRLKHKIGGSDAGHNGLKSITAALGTGEYPRLRIGIGRPEHKSQVSDYVLEPFGAADALLMRERVAWVAENMPKLVEDPHVALAKLEAVAKKA